MLDSLSNQSQSGAVAMFVDPITFPYDGDVVSVARVSTEGRKSVYQTPDGLMDLTISHAIAKRKRSVLRLDLEKVAADPLQPSTSVPYTMSTYIVIDAPLFGFTVAEQALLVGGLAGIITYPEYATKFMGSET